VWPDSQAFIERELADVPAATRRKLVCDNAARLYGF
jgi:predicted TIM-barrel fold metal-dependent hydrolase